MKTFKHDIKVALLGNVSTGKTMTMNALFGNKYGEVSMKRTTAAVNYFKISTSTVPGGTAGSWHPKTYEPRKPESTLKEISEDNRRLRDDTSSTHVQEKWFDIQLDEQLCEMRNDTRLVIVDIPGINEAGACSKYKDYVDKKWHTFDCVVLVMDGKQGVNTEDQVLLLNLVKNNKERIKNVPVIILFNKVDDPEDQEQAELIREAFQEIEALFKNTQKEIHASGYSGLQTFATSPPGETPMPARPSSSIYGGKRLAPSPSPGAPAPASTDFGLGGGGGRGVGTRRRGRVGRRSHGGRGGGRGRRGGRGGTPAPAASAPPPAAGGFGFGGTPASGGTDNKGSSSGGGFQVNLGGGSTRAPAPPPVGGSGFSFDGAPAPAASASSPAAGGFGFGSTPASGGTDNKGSSSGGGFNFGGGSTPAPPRPPAGGSGFSFGGAPAPAASAPALATGSFGFGGTSAPAAPAPAPAAGGFGFGGGAFAFGASWAPSSPFGTQSQFVCGAAPSQVATSTITTQPPIEKTPSHQHNKGAAVVTPNEKEDEEEQVGDGKRHSISSINDAFAKIDLTESHEEDQFRNLPPSVAFIPISALHGFANRCASRMTLDSFSNFFDKELIEKVGKEQIGRRQWKMLSEEERTKAVFDILSDPDECRDVLHDSRYDKFITKLKHFVGGEEVQTRLIEEQIKASLKTILEVSLKTVLDMKPFHISFQAETGKRIVQHIQEAYSKMQSLQKHVVKSNINIQVQAYELEAAFWKAYASVEKSCFENITTFGPGNCHVLSEPVDELEAFHAAAKQIGWSDVEEKIVTRMERLVNQMIHLFLGKASELGGGYSSWSIKSAKTVTDPWKSLSPLDWITIWSSILLLSYDRQFCLAFGTQKMLMERELFEAQTSWHTTAGSRCCTDCHSDLPKQHQKTTCGDQEVFWVKCSTCNIVYTWKNYTVQGSYRCICCSRYGQPNALTCSSCPPPRVSPKCLKIWAQLKYKNNNKPDTLHGKEEPVYPACYKFVSSVRLVDSVKNKNHIGHVAYRFCEFINR